MIEVAVMMMVVSVMVHSNGGEDAHGNDGVATMVTMIAVGMKEMVVVRWWW